MALRAIRLFGDPVLRAPAEVVTTFDAELRKLVRDLTETMEDAPGAGLAAPQIGVLLRVFTYHVDGEIGHLVNPVIVETSPEELVDEEGCLSLPKITYKLARAERVIARGVNAYGDPVTVVGSGRLSRAVLHENDHLDGVLFIDRLDPASRRAALREIREADWSGQQPPVVRESPHPLFGHVY